MMNSKFHRVFLIFLIVFSTYHVSWPADIAVIIVQEFIVPGDDPANDQPAGAKDFTFETIELEDPGLFALISRLEEELGHNVKLYGADNFDNERVEAESDLIWITEEPQSSASGSLFQDSETPVIFQEAFIMDDMGLASPDAEFENNLHTNELRVVNPDHPITQELPETFIFSVENEDTGKPQAVTVVSLLNNNNLTGVGEILVEAPTTYNTDMPDSPIVENVPVVIAVDEGTAINADTSANARWVMFGYSESNISDTEMLGPGAEVSTLAFLNDEGWQLLDQTIAWALDETTGLAHWAVY